MKETWKEVLNYSNYEVSNLGEVRNKRTGRHLKKALYKSGLSIVCLSEKSNTKSCSVGRLVLEAFKPCENMNNLNIKYKDGDRTNCELSNLEWTTLRYVGDFSIMPNELKALRSSISRVVDNTITEWYKKYIEAKQ